MLCCFKADIMNVSSHSVLICSDGCSFSMSIIRARSLALRTKSIYQSVSPSYNGVNQWDNGGGSVLQSIYNLLYIIQQYLNIHHHHTLLMAYMFVSFFSRVWPRRSSSGMLSPSLNPDFNMAPASTRVITMRMMLEPVIEMHFYIFILKSDSRAQLRGSIKRLLETPSLRKMISE